MRLKPALKRTRSDDRPHRPDLVTGLLVVALGAFGVLMVFDASVVEAYHQIGDEWYFITNQSKFLLYALLAGGVAYFFPIKKLPAISLPIIISALFFLIIVLIPGIGSKVQGARRWLDFGLVRFQPSEYAKLAAVIYLSAWFAKARPARSFAVLLTALIALIMLEPDMGTALVITGTAAGMYFLSGANVKKIFRLVIVAALGIGLLVLLAPYRLNRVKTFLNPEHDPLGISYHARQILISLGSGGLTGTGLGFSRQKFQYLPEAATDSIFAVVAEEFGFFGAALLIIALAAIVIRGLRHARLITDPFTANLAAGVSLWFGTQVLLNLMAMVGLIPITGIPLPLISYGGSSLVTMFVGIGLLLKATRYTKGK